MSELMKVSSNPHVRSKTTTSGIMLAVVIRCIDSDTGNRGINGTDRIPF